MKFKGTSGLKRLSFLLLGGVWALFCVTTQAASWLPTTKVKNDSFEVALPSYLNTPLPMINVSNPSPMKVYRFVDGQQAHSVVFNVMVVKITPEMGGDLDNAVKKFAGGIMFGMAKKSGLTIGLGQAIKSVEQKSIHNQIFDQASFVAKSGKTEVYATHTGQYLYAFIMSSRDLVKMTEMRASLSSVKLIR